MVGVYVSREGRQTTKTLSLISSRGYYCGQTATALAQKLRHTVRVRAFPHLIFEHRRPVQTKFPFKLILQVTLVWDPQTAKRRQRQCAKSQVCSQSAPKTAKMYIRRAQSSRAKQGYPWSVRSRVGRAPQP